MVITMKIIKLLLIAIALNNVSLCSATSNSEVQPKDNVVNRLQSTSTPNFSLEEIFQLDQLQDTDTSNIFVEKILGISNNSKMRNFFKKIDEYAESNNLPKTYSDQMKIVTRALDNNLYRIIIHLKIGFDTFSDIIYSDGNNDKFYKDILNPMKCSIVDDNVDIHISRIKNCFNNQNFIRILGDDDLHYFQSDPNLHSMLLDIINRGNDIFNAIGNQIEQFLENQEYIEDKEQKDLIDKMSVTEKFINLQRRFREYLCPVQKLIAVTYKYFNNDIYDFCDASVQKKYNDLAINYINQLSNILLQYRTAFINIKYNQIPNNEVKLLFSSFKHTLKRIFSKNYFTILKSIRQYNNTFLNNIKEQFQNLSYLITELKPIYKKLEIDKETGLDEKYLKHIEQINKILSEYAENDIENGVLNISNDSSSEISSDEASEYDIVNCKCETIKNACILDLEEQSQDDFFPNTEIKTHCNFI